MALPISNQHDIGKMLCKALGLDPDYVARIIIDVRYDFPVLAYVEMMVSDKNLDIDWAASLGHAEVKILDKEP